MKGGRGSRSGKNPEQICFTHSGPFFIVFLPLPPSSLPVLYPSSGATFPPLLLSCLYFSLFFSSLLFFFPLPSASLWASARWYQRSRTPPLTDNSLVGTLLCTVQCTAILPQWGLDLWWMDGISLPACPFLPPPPHPHPHLSSEWYLPDRGRGGDAISGRFFLCGWIVPHFVGG